MSRAVRGIHHVTAIATDPQRNVDFYAGALGLRLESIEEALPAIETASAAGGAA